jgi:protein-serine/threonine kinase
VARLNVLHLYEHYIGRYMYSMEEPKSAPPTGVSPSTPPPGPLLAAPSDTANIPASHAGAPVNQVNQVNPAVDDWVSVNATHGLLNTRLPPFESRDDSPTSPVFPFRAHVRKPTGADLQVQTGLDPYTTAAEFQSEHSPDTLEANTGDQLRHSATAPIAIQDGRLRSNLSAWSMSGSLSPGSTISSPALHALTDLTPLPSPLLMASSPGPWSRAAMRPRSRGASSSSSKDDAFAMLTNGTLSPSPSLKKKGYQKLRTAAVEAAAASMQTEHNNEASRERNRSISEFVPEALRNIHARHVTISNVTPEQFESRTGSEPQLHREAYLAAQRGLVSGPAATGLPTPPASNASVRSVTESEGEEAADDDKTEYLMVRHGLQKTKKYWRPVRQLGQGTFSKVYLATSEKLAAKDPLDESVLDPHKLVAIKVVEHGPAGGADEQRVELSLKREVEMLRSVSHPSLVHLREFDHGDAQALLVLTYCPGGDLFDVATAHRELLNVDFVQRIFAEMVSAVRYLHDKLIVHRDIKLESMHARFRPLVSHV